MTLFSYSVVAKATIKSSITQIASLRKRETPAANGLAGERNGDATELFSSHHIDTGAFVVINLSQKL